METQQTTNREEKVFRTKTGFCHVLPDKIVLTRDGVVGTMAQVAVGNTIFRAILIHGVFSLVMFYAAFTAYQKGNIPQCVIAGVLGGLYLVYGVVRSINNSAVPVIDRQKIKKVLFKKGVEGVTRSRFEVFFENENGKVKKRLILLPGSLMDRQQAETDNALQIMKEEGYAV